MKYTVAQAMYLTQNKLRQCCLVDVHHATGIAVSTLCRWRSDDLPKYPRLGTFKALVNHFNIPVDLSLASLRAAA